jgi:hypothetical protein
MSVGEPAAAAEKDLASSEVDAFGRENTSFAGSRRLRQKRKKGRAAGSLSARPDHRHVTIFSICVDLKVIYFFLTIIHN